VVRATRYPEYFSFNVVRVEEDPGMDVDALVAFADEALAGLAHRRVDFDLVDVAEPLRAGFQSRGWIALRLLWMRHEAALPPGPEAAVEEVPYDAVHDLRITWHHEDHPGQDPDRYLSHAHRISRSRDARVLVPREGGTPVGFAQLERAGNGAEITDVYVRPEYRGMGRSTALTRAAVGLAGNVEDLWLVTDGDDRPKDLYSRLGFRTAWQTMEFLRPP
jgi:ribosomal protein S18 acetylase RimI-like enzyme